MKHVRIRLSRAYDPPGEDDGPRYLVDRVWPRGITKERLQILQWLRDAAPSTELRRWFGHELPRWPEFVERYRAELDGQPAGLGAAPSRGCAGPVYARVRRATPRAGASGTIIAALMCAVTPRKTDGANPTIKRV